MQDVYLDELMEDLRCKKKIAEKLCGNRGQLARQELLDAEHRLEQEKSKSIIELVKKFPNVLVQMNEVIQTTVEQLEILDARIAEPRAREILSGMGIEQQDQLEETFRR